VTEATPVSSVERRAIGLASARRGEAVASEVEEAEDAAVEAAVETSFVTTATKPVISRENALKEEAEVEEVSAVGAADEVVAEAEEEASVTIVKSLAIWPATAPRSV